MSALTVPAPTRTPATPTRATRPALRLVEAPATRGLAPTGPLQAWRRRTVALVLLLALVALGGRAVLGSGAAADGPTMQPVSAVTVVVQPGQTLWDIAQVHTPAGTSQGDYVRALAELNGVTNGAVGAWQVLRLPAA